MIAARTAVSMRSSATPRTGLLIINADDWGCDCGVTDRILDCIAVGTVSSVSAMVFMADSERAAEVARERGIDAGLHLNFTTPFSATAIHLRLADHHSRVSRYLRGNRLAQVVFHPGLARSFEYVVAAQIEEFVRLYGTEPNRFDGHHHMHLCSNVVVGGLIPPGTMVRRNFTFQPSQKGFVNRFYRQAVDRILARRHRLIDYFFALQPLAPSERLRRIFVLSRQFVIEVETHPNVPDEYLFLTNGGIRELCGDWQVASCFGIA
jgi:predicted glycoside hydrolase/deacetylase ChbG (UPF0249 family)